MSMLRGPCKHKHIVEKHFNISCADPITRCSSSRILSFPCKGKVKAANWYRPLSHLDPLRASAFVPLSDWIQTCRAVVNVRGTGDDCFKWVV